MRKNPQLYRGGRGLFAWRHLLRSPWSTVAASLSRTKHWREVYRGGELVMPGPLTFTRAEVREWALENIRLLVSDARRTRLLYATPRLP